MLVRRCHMCGEVHESEGEPIEKCNSCGKHFAPFFYFKEREAPVVCVDNVARQLCIFSTKSKEDEKPVKSFVGIALLW
jgi:predicted  nucleic acid-binding Zn-ribbon protein